MNIKVACIQKRNVFLNSEATFDLLFKYLEQAIQHDAKVIAFPETWLPGYPAWLDYAARACLWREPGSMALHRILTEQALERDDPRFKELQQRCEEASVYVVLGFHERVGRTLFNTIGTFGPSENGKTPHYHQKLTPTYTERLVWGQGDGSELAAVKTPFGPLGALICWEHWIPPLRSCFHAEHEVLHVAQWPTVHEKHQLGSRHYAFEGQCFVMAVGSILTVQDALDGLSSLGKAEPEAKSILESMGQPNDLILRGGSTIISPQADYLLDPMFGIEGIFYADLDLSQVSEGSMYLDTDGHYARPDIFEVQIDRSKKTNVITKKD